MKAYQKPALNFKELRLTEKVAAKCWGNAQIIYYYAATGTTIQIDLSNGCQGNAAAADINAKFAELGITDTVSPNVANTQDSRFSGPASGTT